MSKLKPTVECLQARIRDLESDLALYQEQVVTTEAWIAGWDAAIEAVMASEITVEIADPKPVDA